MNDTLRAYCMASQEQLLNMGAFDPQLGYSFIDNGSNVLAIAHVDVVDDYGKKAVGKGQKGPYEPRTYWEGRIKNQAQANKNYLVTDGIFPCTMATSIALDDRLGVYILMELLPKLGVQPDILLTTNEEIGRTTAASFTTTKKYNWIFQFDRRGLGVVMYQYHDATTEALVRDFGYNVEIGSYSDISALEFLGVKGFNFGTGYDYEHTQYCNCSLETAGRLAKKFATFYHANKDIHMPHTPREYGYWDEADLIYRWDKTLKIYVVVDDNDDAYWTIDPKTGKEVWSLEEAECEMCGIVVDANDLTNGLCYDCLWTENHPR